MNKYLDFCNRCMQGKINFHKKFYNLDNDLKLENKTGEGEKTSNVDISVVTPTQAAVEQARSEVKQEKAINRGKKGKYNQFGGSTSSIKSKTRKKGKNTKTPKKVLRSKKGGKKKIVNITRTQKGLIKKKIKKKSKGVGIVQYGCSSDISKSVSTPTN